jgi:ABC-type uncharacterized transport system substrate-binding protein
VAAGGVAARTAKKVTSTTPIVFTAGDAVGGLGLVSNLARPGGNARASAPSPMG